MNIARSAHSSAWRRFILLAALLLPAATLRSQESAQSSGSQDASAPAASGDATSAQSAPSSSTPVVEPGVEGLDRLQGGLPPGAFGQNPPGIPYSSVLTTTGADVNDINILNSRAINTTTTNYPKAGEVEGSVSARPFAGGPLGLPFIHAAPEPEDADIKAGPFFVKFHYLDGLALYDENIYRTKTDRKSELLVLLRLNLTIIAQLTDDLQFAVSGNLTYLPLQNQVGIEGAEYGALGFLAVGPLLAAQMVYDTAIAGWPVRFADDFRAGTASYSDDTTDNFDLFQGDYLERDETGRYTFHAGRSGLRDDGFNNNTQNDALSLFVFSNTVSALTDRLMPGDVRLTLRFVHQDLWYNQDTRGLPESRDDFFAAAVSERENQRFKPYVTYEATYDQGTPGVTQTAIAGFTGPIDDQLFLQAQTGYFISSNNHQDVLFQVDLTHVAGPYTTENFVVDRSLGYFDQEVRTSEYYRLDQTLGPTLYGTLFAVHSDYRELINDGENSRTEDLGGVQLGWYLGPKTSLQVAGIYEIQKYSGGLKVDTSTARVILNRTVSDTLTFQLLYEYQHAVANRPGESFYDNLVYFRVVKSLD